MKNNVSFVFECEMRHQFVLSKKQIINGKWCKVCAKIVAKLRRKIAKEQFSLVSLEGSEEVVTRARKVLSEGVEQCRELIEQQMMREQVVGEVEERRNLESRFQRWRKQGTTTQQSQSKSNLQLPRQRQRQRKPGKVC